MKSILHILAAIALSVSALAQAPGVTTGSVFKFAGVPSGGTSEVQTVTIGGTPTGGTFVLTPVGSRATAPITWSATNATLIANIDAALEALNLVGANGVTTAAGSLTAGIGTVTLTFTGKLARFDVPAFSATSNLTGTAPTVAVATTTPGVVATFRAAPTGALLVDTVTPDLYINDSLTANAPTWTKVSP